MSPTAISVSVGRPSTPTVPGCSAWGMSELSPLPSPLRRDIVHLLGHIAVGKGAARTGIERDDRLAERRRLRQPDRPRDDGAQHLVAEVVADLADDLIGELRTRVVHDTHERADVQPSIEVAADEVDVAQQLAETFEGVVLALDRNEHLVGRA